MVCTYIYVVLAKSFAKLYNFFQDKWVLKRKSTNGQKKCQAQSKTCLTL